MTKQRDPNPQPTPGVGSVIYLAPRSKEPRLDDLYVFLHNSGWRYDTVTTTWYTPIGEPVQFGRLEWNPDCTRAWLQPPSVEDPARGDGLRVRPAPIATFAYFKSEHFVGWDTARPPVKANRGVCTICGERATVLINDNVARCDKHGEDKVYLDP